MILALTGRPYSGKTTTADLIEAELHRRGRSAVRADAETAADIVADIGIHAIAHGADIGDVLAEDFDAATLDRLRPLFRDVEAARAEQFGSQTHERLYDELIDTIADLLSPEAAATRLVELFDSSTARGLDVIVDDIDDHRLVRLLSPETLLVALDISPTEQIRRGFDRDGIVIDDPDDSISDGTPVDLRLTVDRARPSEVVDRVLALVDEWDAVAVESEVDEDLDTGMSTRVALAYSGIEVETTVSFYSEPAFAAVLPTVAESLSLTSIMSTAASSHGFDISTPEGLLECAAAPLTGELILDTAYGEDREPLLVTTRPCGDGPVPILVAAQAMRQSLRKLADTEESGD